MAFMAIRAGGDIEIFIIEEGNSMDAVLINVIDGSVAFLTGLGNLDLRATKRFDLV